MQEPDWVKYFLELGAALNKQLKGANRVSVLLTLPTDAGAASLIAAGTAMAAEFSLQEPVFSFKQGDQVTCNGVRCEIIGFRGDTALIRGTSRAARVALGNNAQVNVRGLKPIAPENSLARIIGGARFERHMSTKCSVVIIGSKSRLDQDGCWQLSYLHERGQTLVRLSELLGGRCAIASSRRGMISESSLSKSLDVAIFADTQAFQNTDDAELLRACNQVFLISRDCTYSRALSQAAQDLIAKYQEARAGNTYRGLPSPPPGIQWEAFAF